MLAQNFEPRVEAARRTATISSTNDLRIAANEKLPPDISDRLAWPWPRGIMCAASQCGGGLLAHSPAENIFCDGLPLR
jgi:hypothetical protein